MGDGRMVLNAASSFCFCLTGNVFFPFVLSLSLFQAQDESPELERQTDRTTFMISHYQRVSLVPQPTNVNPWETQMCFRKCLQWEKKISNSNCLFKRKKWRAQESGFNQIFLQEFYKGSYIGFLFTDCLITNKLSTKIVLVAFSS